jgi:Transposase
VLDAFHVTRLGFAAVDDVRRWVQQQDLGHRGRKGDPLYSVRRVLPRGHEHLTDTAWDRLLTGLDVGDVDGQVAAAWIAAQDLRLLYWAAPARPPSGGCTGGLVHCADSEVPELHRLAATIDAWRPELLAYFDTAGVSNGAHRSDEPADQGDQTDRDSETSTTTDSGCTPASTGTLLNQHESEAGYHAWLRRARLLGEPESHEAAEVQEPVSCPQEPDAPGQADGHARLFRRHQHLVTYGPFSSVRER